MEQVIKSGEALIEYCFNNIQLIKQFRTVLHHYRFQPGSISLSREEVRDFGMVTHWAPETHPEGCEIISTFGKLLSDTTGIWKSPDGSFDSITAHKNITAMLRTVLNKFQGKLPTEQDIRLAVNTFLEEHLRPEYMAFVPLYGIALSREKYALSETVSLVNLSTNEREQYASELVNSPFALFKVEEFVESNYWLVAKLNGPEGKDEIVRKLVEHVLTSMRLAGPGSVGTLRGFTKYKNLGYRFSSAYSILDLEEHRIEKQFLAPTDEYAIEDNISNVVKLYSLLSHREVALELGGAISRYNLSYTRRRDEDAIVDLATVLESTLLRKLEGEKAFQMSLRGARLLGKSPETAGQYFRKVKLINKLRNLFIHENMSLRGIKDTELLDFSRTGIRIQTQEVVALVLKEYIDAITQGRSVEQLNKILDMKARGEMA